jgi:hypothetical protein
VTGHNRTRAIGLKIRVLRRKVGSSPTAPTNELAAKEHLDDRRRRGVTRVRRRQEGHRTQAPPPSAQGLVLEARVLSTNIQDRDGIETLLEPTPDRHPRRLTRLWIDAGYTGQAKGAGSVEGDAGVDGRDSAPSAEAGPGESDEEVGEGVGQRRSGHRPEEAAACRGSQAVPAEEVGGGAHLFLVGPEQEDEQGLRKVVRKRGSVRLRGHDTSDGQEASP